MVEVWIRPWRAEPATAATRRGRTRQAAPFVGRNERRKFWNFADTAMSGHGGPSLATPEAPRVRSKFQAR